MKIDTTKTLGLALALCGGACSMDTETEFRGEEHESTTGGMGSSGSSTFGDDEGGFDTGTPDAGEKGGMDDGAETGDDGLGGCTLTQGYWKNHNVEGNASTDAWPISEETELCGQTWLDILWTPPKGDAWIILAHQYIAAELNVASGAGVDADIDMVLNEANAMLAQCEILAGGRADALALASFLDAYNNGDVGPGHCDDDDDDDGAEHDDDDEDAPCEDDDHDDEKDEDGEDD